MPTSPINLLQELGLNKYEAEAYYTLLTQGSLTGYELGKRSQIPLSRSYDVLERLSQRGLALVQPGEPARYKALEPALFLSQVRSAMEQTLNTLDSALTIANLPETSGEFWVIRTCPHILERIQTLCAQARQTLQLALPTMYLKELATCLANARERNCIVTLVTHSHTSVLLIIDAREALLGTLEPGDSCQAIMSANPALLTVMASYFQISGTSAADLSPVYEQPSRLSDNERDWLAWENRKQQRLHKNPTDQRIA